MLAATVVVLAPLVALKLGRARPHTHYYEGGHPRRMVLHRYTHVAAALLNQGTVVSRSRILH